MVKTLATIKDGWVIKADKNGYQLCNKTKRITWYFSTLSALLSDMLEEGMKNYIKGPETILDAIDRAKKDIDTVAESIISKRLSAPRTAERREVVHP